MGLGSIIAGLFFGGIFVLFGGTHLLYPEATYRVLAGWKYDDTPELSTAGRLNQRILGGGVVIMGLMIGYYFIQ